MTLLRSIKTIISISNSWYSSRPKGLSRKLKDSWSHWRYLRKHTKTADSVIWWIIGLDILTKHWMKRTWWFNLSISQIAHKWVIVKVQLLPRVKRERRLMCKAMFIYSSRLLISLILPSMITLCRNLKCTGAPKELQPAPLMSVEPVLHEGAHNSASPCLISPRVF